MDTQDKTLTKSFAEKFPRGPQVTGAEPDVPGNSDALALGLEAGLEPWEEKADLAATAVEDVVEDKTGLRLNRWQIAGIVAGSLAVAAGVAGALYARSQQTPKARLERFAHKAGLKKFSLSKRALGYRHEVDRARNRLSHFEDQARHHIAQLEDMARNRLSQIDRPHLSDLKTRHDINTARNKLMAYFR